MTDVAPWRRACLGWPRRALAMGGTLLLSWHAAAIVFAPMPPSEVTARLEPYFAPYLSALALTSTWAFFAPHPGGGSVLRYVVDDARGGRRELPLTEALDRRRPAFFRYTTLYAAVSAERPMVAASVAQFLCRRHGLVAPARITFLVVRQRLISPAAFLAGHRPRDDDHTEREWLDPIACGAGTP